MRSGPTNVREAVTPNDPDGGPHFTLKLVTGSHVVGDRLSATSIFAPLCYRILLYCTLSWPWVPDIEFSVYGLTRARTGQWTRSNYSR